MTIVYCSLFRLSAKWLSAKWSDFLERFLPLYPTLVFICPFVRPSHFWLLDNNQSTAQPNLFKLSHNAVYHKIQVKFDYGVFHILWWKHTCNEGMLRKVNWCKKYLWMVNVKYTLIKFNLYFMVYSIVLKFEKIWLSGTLNIIRKPKKS
jgi:hypothetical protein